MTTLIKEIINVNSEGLSFKLTEKASLNGGLSTDQWFVSWNKIGRALFGEQYSDAASVNDLRMEIVFGEISNAEKIELAKSEAHDYRLLVLEARAALQEIYANNGEDARIEAICSPLIDKLDL